MHISSMVCTKMTKLREASHSSAAYYPGKQIMKTFHQRQTISLCFL